MCALNVMWLCICEYVLVAKRRFFLLFPWFSFANTAANAGRGDMGVNVRREAFDKSEILSTASAEGRIIVTLDIALAKEANERVGNE